MEKGPAIKVYVFRHGQTYYNKNQMFTGFKDSKLTPLGIRQAKSIAKKLKGKEFQVAFQTRLSRSKDTLKEVLKFHPECNKIITDNRMIERSYGKLSGKHHSSVIKTFGQEKYDTWHRSFGVSPPGGESFSDVGRRVKPFVKDLISFMKKSKSSVAISAHGNSIRLFRRIVEKSSEKEAREWTIPYDKVFVYELRNKSLRFQKLI